MKKLLDENIQDKTDGKNIESLARSRQIREEFISEFGLVPSSILINDKTDRTIDLAKNNEKRGYICHRKQVKEITDKELNKIFSSCGKGEMALSAFPQNIGRILVKFYCPDSGTVYDPFAGHNSRMQLCYEAGRNYIRVDVSKIFMEYNRKIKQILESGLIKRENSITLIEGSSDKVDDLPDCCADFTVTSPPYWNIEYYGDEPEQLGNAKTYKSFLELLSNHIKENYRILKPDSFCCWNINDFLKNGTYLAYHADLIPIFINAGFILHTIYIIDHINTVRMAFIQETIKTKRFPKRHEYVLVFKK